MAENSGVKVPNAAIWSLAALGGSIIAGIYGAMLQIFFFDYLGLDWSWIVVDSIIYLVWNALNDPIFGFLSDASQSSKGRRIPFMRYTAPFLAITFISVWFADASWSQVGLFAWMIVTTLLYDTAYTIVFVVYSALLPEVSEDDAVRTKLNGVAGFFQLVGMVFGFLIPDFFRPKGGDDLSFTPFRAAMVVVGIVGALLIIATTYHVKERPEFTRVDKPLGLVDSVKYTFKSRSFLILTAANFFSILLQSMLVGSVFYLADYILEMPTVVALVFLLVPMVVGIPVGNYLRGRVGVLRADQFLLAVGGVGLVLLIVLPPTLVFVSLVLAGFGLAGPLLFTNVLFAQVTDEDELVSGVRREAAFFGTNALLTKPAQSVALALPGIILTAMNYVKRASGEALPEQPASAILGIKIIVALIPGICMLVEVVILQFFPLKGEYLEQVRAQVLTLHAEKHAKLEKLDA
ncbi:MAG: MFS transporter [Promethearchaeota archaeon]